LERLELVFLVGEAGRFRLDLYTTYAPDFGQLQARLDGEEGDLIDAYAPVVIPSGPLGIGEAELSPGEHSLGFTVTARNPESEGTFFGIDCLSLFPLD